MEKSEVSVIQVKYPKHYLNRFYYPMKYWAGLIISLLIVFLIIWIILCITYWIFCIVYPDCKKKNINKKCKKNNY